MVDLCSLATPESTTSEALPKKIIFNQHRQLLNKDTNLDQYV